MAGRVGNLRSLGAGGMDGSSSFPARLWRVVFIGGPRVACEWFLAFCQSQ